MDSLSRRALLQTFTLGSLAAANPRLAAAELDNLKAQVTETERAFAKAMADRDPAAFRAALSEETVFFGEREILRGRNAVMAQWQKWFEGPKAPFSWQPERVEVLESRALAFSTGPVHNPDGARIGTFNSVWRRESDHRWRIVFDIGCPRCPDC
ncbi:MAG: nuclear transport factor 2 family protein [Verrucomicrobiales bacterium]|nr:nuclear transport factor 2 family protein [Verrucomicrobiales bacterium]